MENENIPLNILIQILSSSKASKKHSFEAKIKIISDWVGNSEERKKNIGLFRLENGDFFVDTSILSNIMSLQPKSIVKNFSIAGYKKKAVIELGKSFLFSKAENSQQTLDLAQSNDNLPENTPPELWSPQIEQQWKSFSETFPDLLITDLDSFFPNQNGGFLKTSQILHLIYNADIVTPRIFGSIIKHFGPFQLVNAKIGVIAMSALSRGWSFNDEDEKHIIIEDPNKFVFNDSKKTCTLLNNDSFNKMDLYWLKKEATDEFIDLEEFWLQEFPSELQSKEYLSDMFLKYFPEE